MKKIFRRFVLFLIRKKLGLKKYESFRFTNQKSDAVYWFTSSAIIKSCYCGRLKRPSGVSLNWLLNDDCKIEKIKFRKKDRNERNHI